MTTHQGGEAQLPFHDDAALFPLMEEEELRALADDILAHGQRNPARRHQGKIIDGRNRVLACHLAEART
jgi:ParB-like chromosome segregation protein Spo0J